MCIITCSLCNLTNKYICSNCQFCTILYTCTFHTKFYFTRKVEPKLETFEFVSLCTSLSFSISFFIFFFLTHKHFISQLQQQQKYGVSLVIVLTTQVKVKKKTWVTSRLAFQDKLNPDLQDSNLFLPRNIHYSGKQSLKFFLDCTYFRFMLVFRR